LDSKATDATNRWVRYLEENNIILVRGDVLNDKSVVRVTRPCGHQIEATLGNIKRYQCTACRSGEEYYLYLLDAGNGVYKIGRAIDINRRIKTLNRYWEYELNCVHSVKGIYADIKMAEEYILKKYSSNRLFNTAVFDGATEFLELEDISELIEDMNSRF